jgi:hypothetical protein
MDAVRPPDGYCSLCGFPLEGTIWQGIEDKSTPGPRLRIGSDGRVSLEGHDNVQSPKGSQPGTAKGFRSERPGEKNWLAAKVTFYVNGQAIGSQKIDTDVFEIGRSDIDFRPDFDLSKFDPEYRISRRHIELIRRDRQFFVRRVSEKNSAHLNRQALSHNQDFALKSGDAIVLSQFVGILFELTEAVQ